MAIRLADTARPNNYVDAEHPGTFPVAYAEDVWFDDGTRLSEKTFDGQSIQKEELPLASEAEEGNIYQYVGETGTYTKGYFYECVSDDESTPTYSWKEAVGGSGYQFSEDFVDEDNNVSLVPTQRIFTGTQDEWDALTTAEKKTYGQVNITDDDGGANLEYYSTEETKTNKVWIDGKTIYRKVYRCTVTTTLTAGEDWKNIPGWDVNVSGMATITYLFGSVYYWGRIDWYKHTNNKLLWCSLNSAITVPVDAALTIEYTKEG